MDEERYKKSIEDDKQYDMPFFCKIGQSEAELHVYIEPDPHGDGQGTHAHFHTVIMCPKTKIVDFPEPDRCQITDETCSFWEPLGGYKRDKDSRKWIYAQQFLHHFSSIEFLSAQLFSVSLISKGYKIERDLPDLSYINIVRFLFVLNLIDESTHKDLNAIRKKRNKLAHEPNSYLSFQEQELFDMMLNSRHLADLIRNKVSELSSK